MELTVKERLSLLQLLPTQGSISEMVDIYDLARELKLTDEEKSNINYIETSTGVKWDYTKEISKNISLNSDQNRLIINQIDMLDRNKQIPLGLVELILKLKGYGEYKELNTNHT